ncbi:hypothetical protein DPMN_069583 [Dreissena polymorpha]|uniref:Uncharacterized protein n=1 Tax=Dreissena polymorpha TaxID=45954 RepID=A0A9D4BN73_DREPO|nr:hypothetical protein DPMN_069583 [Dreissena polymorpha]
MGRRVCEYFEVYAVLKRLMLPNGEPGVCLSLPTYSLKKLTKMGRICDSISISSYFVLTQLFFIVKEFSSLVWSCTVMGGG